MALLPLDREPPPKDGTLVLYKHKDGRYFIGHVYSNEIDGPFVLFHEPMDGYRLHYYVASMYRVIERT